MPRLTTRLKRKLNLGATSQKHRYYKGNVEGRKRMKSFADEAKAKQWATEQKLDTAKHELRQHPSGKWQWHVKNPRLE
jgi:hypothetical protein